MPDSAQKQPHSSGLGDKNDHVTERRSLRDYYIILRERLWIALPTALLVSAGFGYMQARKPQMFSATATMLFEKPERIMTGTGVTDNSITTDADLLTEVQILNSAVLRTAVFESFVPEEIRVLQRPYLKDLTPGTAPPTDQRLLGNPRAGPLTRVYGASVNVTHKDPQAAALVANRYVKQYIQYKSDILSGKNTNADTDLRNLRTKLEASLKDAKDKVQRFVETNKIAGLDTNSNPADARLKAIESEIVNGSVKINNLEGQIKQVRDYQRDGKSLLELNQIAGYGNILALKMKLDEDNTKWNQAGNIYGPKAPNMIALSDMIANDESRLKDAQEQALQNLLASLSREQAGVARLEEQKKEATTQSIELRAKQSEYDNLKHDVDVAQINLKTVEERLGQTSAAKDIEKIPLRPLDAAVPPGAPYEPNIQAITKNCIGIGVLVFIGVAVGLSFIDDRVKSAWDIEHFIGVNLLGIVPDLSALKDEEKYTLVLNNRQVPGMESFLGVYSSVKIHSKLDFPKSILITSTIPGEGKTLISSNLAGSFARHGKRTLLIDCDLRRPMVHRHFKQENTAGLIPWFENGANLEGDLTLDPHLGIIKISDSMSLLCSGGRSKRPTELFESPTFGQLVDRLKKHYDLVVIDSPPLGAVADSLLIAECTDEVIYVCRFNRAYKKHIRLYIKALRSGKNEILGVVLNGLSPRRIEYYSNYRYYRSYKKYYGAQT